MMSRKMRTDLCLCVPTWPCVCALMFLLAMPMALFAQQSDRQENRTQRNKELEAKVAEAKNGFDLLRGKLRAASEQTRSNIQAELEVVKSELKKSYDQLQATHEQDVQQLNVQLNDAWAKLETSGDEVRDIAAKELEEIRAEWNSAIEKRQQVHHQRVTQIREELTEIELQIKSASHEATARWEAKRIIARKEYQDRAAKLRTSYQEYIESLRGEGQRIYKNAQATRKDVQSQMMAKADELNAQINAAYEEMHAGHLQMATKVNKYVEQTQASMKTASGNAQQELRSELDEISQSAAKMRAKMAASYEEYHASLVVQIDLVKQRTNSASSETKIKLNELANQLEEKLQKTEQDTVKAYQAYADAVQSEISRMQEQLDQTDAATRAGLIKAIERRQAELEKVKEKLR